MSDDSVGEALDKLGGFGNFAVSKGLVTVTEKKRIEYATLNLIKQLDGEDFPSFVAAIAESTSCDFPIAVCLKGILVKKAKSIIDDAWRSIMLASKCAFRGVTLSEVDLVRVVQLEDTGIVTCEEDAARAQTEIASKHRCLLPLLEHAGQVHYQGAGHVDETQRHLRVQRQPLVRGGLAHIA